MRDRVPHGGQERDEPGLATFAHNHDGVAKRQRVCRQAERFADAKACAVSEAEHGTIAGLYPIIRVCARLDKVLRPLNRQRLGHGSFCARTFDQGDGAIRDIPAPFEIAVKGS